MQATGKEVERYEYIKPEDKELHNSFITILHISLLLIFTFCRYK